MTVKSHPMHDGQARDNDEYEDERAPISRKFLDMFRTPARIALGIIFVAYSSIGTVIGVQSDLAPALTSRTDGLMLGYVIGFALAILIFTGELLLAEVSPFWYSVVLLPDVWYTYRLSGWIGAIIRTRVQAEPLIETVAVVIVTIIFSLAVAYFGERLLFGRRRRRKE